MTVKEGDIFISKLERNFFGAFRILKTNGKTTFTEDIECFLVCITQYIGIEKPKIIDKEICKILIENRFFCNNKPAIGIRIQKGLENFEYLGNVPLNADEKKYKIKIGDGSKGCYPFYGAFDEKFGQDAFFEWRWKNEKEEFQNEVEKDKIKSQKRAEEYRKRNMKPKKMMDDQSFWEVIEKIDWSRKEDEEKMLPAIKFLANKKVSEIKQFQENLTYKLYLLDNKENAKNIGENSFENEYFSADYFLYIRCCVIANGKSMFESVIVDSKKMPKDLDFEPILYLSSSAYETKMKKDFEYESGCDYETYSNIKGWE
ncbi:DUF4240 domain-containing protein [Cellulophaga sp. E16_2]|uniref:DUF4240 domain-containing protein n=1 Tax=Cellulophaga sp. E16_2 TaxID=2789297 RepID=UPI001A93A3DE|nr:DUF4240 domain-containing protein [Cellulophaga sp. E16_2]MBO0593936.1 DUF4240 domain-containing protein [Cellulophaga sp. E16_2]